VLYGGRATEPAAISDQNQLSPADEAGLDTTIQQIAGTHGHVSNLMQTLALAPHGLAAFAALDTYVRYQSALTERHKLVAMVIAVRDVHYGWTHYAPQALAAGITEDQLLRLREGRTPRDMASADRALCDYAFEITTGRRVPARVAEDMHAHFTPPQIVDLALLIAHTVSIAALVIGLDVPIETPEVLAFELDWQKKKAAG
jgi:alkylhydroperoxidase family enzyme